MKFQSQNTLIVAILSVLAIAAFSQKESPPVRYRHILPYQQIQHGISQVEIDSCEYILVVINYNIQLTHKANCKNKAHKLL